MLKILKQWRHSSQKLPHKYIPIDTDFQHRPFKTNNANSNAHTNNKFRASCLALAELIAKGQLQLKQEETAKNSFFRDTSQITTLHRTPRRTAVHNSEKKSRINVNAYIDINEGCFQRTSADKNYITAVGTVILMLENERHIKLLESLWKGTLAEARWR